MLGNHLFGIYEKALPAELSWPERLAAAKELGFDYVEISIDETDQRLARLDWSKEERLALVQAIADTGIAIPSMCFSGHRRFPFGSADPAIRQKARELMEKAILFARDTGIRVIQLAGYDVYYEPSTQESLQYFEEGLRWAVALGEKYQITLAMEIMDTPLFGSISKYLAYKNRILSPYFMVYPDLGNLTAWGNDVLQELQLGLQDIVAIHVKETLPVTADFPGKFKCVPFGTGTVQFAQDFAALEQMQYHGPYMMEMWYDPNTDWKKEIMQAKAFIEEQFAKGATP